MKKGTKNIAYGIVVVLLLCLIVTVANKNSGGGNNEVKLGREFVSKLVENGVIDEVSDIALQFNVTEKKDKLNGEVQSYTLNSDDLSIEINKEGNVINFIDKIPQVKVKSITKEDAINLGEEYIETLCTGDYKVEQIIDKTLKDDVDYYSIIFKKYDGDYPYYSLDAVLNISKSTGKLVGYMNKYGNIDHEEVEINITKEDAKERALKSFNSMMKSGDIIDDVTLAYGEARDSREDLVLCYIVRVKGKTEDGVEKEIVYFISSKTGSIINSFSNSVEKIKSE